LSLQKKKELKYYVEAKDLLDLIKVIFMNQQFLTMLKIILK